MFNDSVERITPQKVFLHPFITMSHLIDSTGPAASKSECHVNEVITTLHRFADKML